MRNYNCSSGHKDDILVVDPWKKLAGQIIATGMIVVLSGIRIDNFYGLFGITRIPLLVSILFTVFVLLLISNGFNLIDGIDGLASGIGILTSCAFGIWFWMTGNIDYTVLSFILWRCLRFSTSRLQQKNKLFLRYWFFIMDLHRNTTCRFLQFDVNITGNLYIQSAPVVIGILIISLTPCVFLYFAWYKEVLLCRIVNIYITTASTCITYLQATFNDDSCQSCFYCLLYPQGIGIIRPWL
jgi:hypothetical protein